MVISIVNQKGGTGKTTLAINLADAFAQNSLQVLLLDADPQESAARWFAVKRDAGFHVRAIRGADIVGIVQKARSRYDSIIIDSPPSVAKTTKAVLSVADQAIVPIAPSPLDIWSSKDIISMIRVAQNARHDFKVRLLICKTIVGTRLNKAARSTLNGFGIPLFRSMISQRVAYVESMIAGQSVLTYAPESVAAREIASLCREII